LEASPAGATPARSASYFTCRPETWLKYEYPLGSVYATCNFTYLASRRDRCLTTAGLGELASRSRIMHVQPTPTRDGKRQQGSAEWPPRSSITRHGSVAGWMALETAASPRALRTLIGVAVRGVLMMQSVDLRQARGNGAALADGRSV
jgi:hypothetical protein